MASAFLGHILVTEIEFEPLQNRLVSCNAFGIGHQDPSESPTV